MIDKLNLIVKTIVSHKDWDNDTKIRYAYLELGKLVHKDAMFFYTIQSNLLTQNKTDIQYDLETVNRIMNTENLFDYKVICRNSAEMLNYILVNSNIGCEIRRFTEKTDYVTEDGKVEIIHYVVVATGNDNKKYFLTLNPDLPNIKLGRRTSHFANSIGYYNEITTKDENGNEIVKREPRYEGEEVKYSVLTDEEIKKIDERIGYTEDIVIGDEKDEYSDVFFDMISKMYKFNSRYMELISTQTRFYYDLARLLNDRVSLIDIIKSKDEPTIEEINESNISFNIKERSYEEWQDVKRFILLNIMLKIYKDYDLRINSVLIGNYYNLIDSRNYTEIFNIFKRDIFTNPENKKKVNEVLGDKNPLLKVKQISYICSIIDDYTDGKIDVNDFKKDLKKYIELISKLFIPEMYLPSSIFSSNIYLTHKITLAFNEIFDIGHKTMFNDLEIAEQIVIIKEILDSIISDKINIKNNLLATVVFDKENKKPYYLMCVNTYDMDKVKTMSYTPILFDLKENKLLFDKSLATIYDEFYVIKDANMKLMIEETDNRSK